MQRAEAACIDGVGGESGGSPEGVVPADDPASALASATNLPSGMPRLVDEHDDWRGYDVIDDGTVTGWVLVERQDEGWSVGWGLTCGADEAVVDDG